MTAPRRMDTPFAPMALVLAASTVFVLVHLAFFHGDASRFVLAGDGLSDPARVPRSLYVLRGTSGYDGQAFYRLALDPLTRKRTDDGITLDTPPYRQQRIGYPLLAWALSGGGSPSALPWALIAVNVAAMGAIGWFGGALAIALGRHALWGTVFAMHPGFVVSVARDLSEPLAAAFMLAGLLGLRRSRATWAAIALTAAALTRETTAVVPLGLAIAWLLTKMRRSAPRRPAREFLIPLGVLGAWQLLLLSWWGEVPFTSNKNATTGPLAGLVRHVGDVLSHASFDGIVQLLEIVFIVCLVLAAVFVLRSHRLLSHERWGLAGAAVSASLLSVSVWFDHAHYLRALTELYLLGALVVVAAWPKKPRALLVASAAFTLILALTYARSL